MTLGRLLAWILGLGAVFAGGVVLADLYLLPKIVHYQKEILVPGVTGLSIDEARAELAKLGLEMEVGEEIHSEGQPPGQVLEQFPPEMRTIRRGRPVRVVVSKGEALAHVPDLSGMSVRQSELTLLREGLKVGSIARCYDPQGELGVVAQRPYPGLEVQRGTAVTMLVREGHERIYHIVPDLRGRNLVRVREELKTAGFKVGTEKYRREPDAFPGIILEQWPPAGSSLPQGGSIDLVASSRG
jgi:serine/threonine-protein kinase